MRFPNHPAGQYWVTFYQIPAYKVFLYQHRIGPGISRDCSSSPKHIAPAACLPIFLTIVGFYAKIQSIKKEEIDTFFYTNFPKKIKTTISKLCMKKG